MLDFTEVVGMLLVHPKLYANLSAVIFRLHFGNFSLFAQQLAGSLQRSTWTYGVGLFSMYLDTNGIKEAKIY